MPTYPCFQQTPNSACSATPSYPARECTSFAAYKGSQALGHTWPEGWGDAMLWPGKAHAAGFTVNGTPAEGTVMCLGPWVNGAGEFGHVSWVVHVEPATVLVQEFNFLVKFGYDERDALIAGAQFIHLTHSPSPAPGDDDLTPQQAQMLTDIHQAIFAGAPDQGTAPWNNVEIIRRQNVQLGADYRLSPGPVPPAKPGTP